MLHTVITATDDPAPAVVDRISTAEAAHRQSSGPRRRRLGLASSRPLGIDQCASASDTTTWQPLLWGPRPSPELPNIQKG